MSAFHRLRTFLHSLHGGLLRKNGHKDTNGSRSNGQPTKTFHTGEGGVVCELCHHEAALNVDGYGEAVPVPAFGPRMVCTACEIIGAHARPNCQERQMQESLTGEQWGTLKEPRVSSHKPRGSEDLRLAPAA